jgi:cell division protein FtsB
MALGAAEVSVILNGAAISLGVFYGFWLKSVVDERVKSKDATIETLKTERDKLAKETAPALVAQVKQLSEYAESMAKLVQDERKQREELERKLRAVVAESGATDEVMVFEGPSDALAQQVKDMQDTIEALKKSTIQLSEPGGYLGRIELPSRMGKLSDMLGNAAYQPPPSGGFNTIKPSPTDKAPDTKTKKPKFNI